MRNMRWVVFALGVAAGLTLLVWGCLGGVTRASAAVRYVAPGGQCGGAAPCYATLQEAVDAAASGDELRVATGRYTELYTRTWGVSDGHTYTVTQLALLSKSLTVRGGYTISDWNTADPIANPVTLDAQGRGRVFLIGHGYTVTLEGLRMVNGRGWATPNDLYTPYDGGAIYNALWMTDTSHLTVRHCEIVSSTHTGSNGGAVNFNLGVVNALGGYRGALMMEDNRFTGNTGGVGGALSAKDAVVQLARNHFENNTGTVGVGGVALYNCTALVSDNVFENNRALTNDGGGLAISWGDVTLTRNTFRNNSAAGQGGGLLATVGAGVSESPGPHAYTITHNLFENNLAGLNAFNVQGGGARLSVGEEAMLLFSHNQVRNNVALGCQNPTNWYLGAGGGVWIQIAFFTNGQATVADNLIQDNWATDSRPAPPRSGATSGCVGSGGGLWVQGAVALERNHIRGNRAAYHPDFGHFLPVFGGGVYIAPNSTVTLTNNLIAENRTFEQDDDPIRSDTYSDGGALYIGGQTTYTQTRATLLHNTIANNQSPAIVNESAGITLSHIIMAGHDIDLRTLLDRSGFAPSLPPVTVADYTLWYPALTTQIEQGTFNHSHDFTGDPGFVATAQDAYHLGAGSAAVDKGAGIGVMDDIDGNPRPLGAGYDLGADEYTGIDLSTSYKRVAPTRAGVGEAVTYTLVLRNSGSASAVGSELFDPLPAAVTYVPASVWASTGATDDAQGIRWQGTLPAGQSVTVTFQVTVNQAGLICNMAWLTDTYGMAWALTADLNLHTLYLPLTLREPAP